MAFNFVKSLVSVESENEDNDNISSSVDDLEGDYDDESDLELESEPQTSATLDIDSDSEHSDLDSDLDLGADGDTMWSKTLKTVEINMFTDGVGPKTENIDLDYDADPLEFFFLFFPVDLVDQIAEQTNTYVRQKGATNFKPVTTQDIRTFLFVNFIFGIHKLPSYILYWSTDPLLRVSCVADVISRNRYQAISRYLHISNNDDFVPKGPLFKIRPVITAVRTACTEMYRPGAALSFDEAMIPFRGRLWFKQYIKGKPHPWGVKVWCCCDSATSYLLDFDFYTGKSDTQMPHGLGYHVIWKLGQPFLRRNHHFYFDNFFSSVKLAKDLLDQQTYSCATVRKNRKDLPTEFKRNIGKNQCMMRQMGNLVACWWRDKRPIMMETATRRTKDGPVEKEIPQPVAFYNANMGGVDKNDQLRAYYTIGRKSMKWWRCCFWYLLEVAAVNAYIVYSTMPRPNRQSKKLSHFNFHLAIARGLLRGSSCRLKSAQETLSAAGMATPGTSPQHRRVRLHGRKKMCIQCKQKGVVTATGRRPETVFGCHLCKVHLCGELCFAEFHATL